MRQYSGYTGGDRYLAEHYRLAHRGVVERLSDPYLTEHDRWVLRQFADFLSGRTPEPDPRVAPRSPAPPLYARVRRSTL